MVNDRDPSCAVRVFDLNTGDNYALVPPARRKTAGLPSASAPARDADPSGRRLTCVCYDCGVEGVGVRATRRPRHHVPPHRSACVTSR